MVQVLLDLIQPPQAEPVVLEGTTEAGTVFLLLVEPVGQMVGSASEEAAAEVAAAADISLVLQSTEVLVGLVVGLLCSLEEEGL